MKSLFGGSSRSAPPAPTLESLESRLLLSGTLPTFVQPLTDQYMAADGALTLGIEGFQPGGAPLTISAVSDNPNISVFVPNETHYGMLYFVANDGVTPIGQILVQLFDTRGSTAAARFETLASNAVSATGQLDPNGTPFYSHVAVHRVIPNFMIQTGDAVNGNGTGGSPLGKFADAFDPTLSFSGPGVLAMANSGANSNDCQFFITDAPYPSGDQTYMIFGQVISGMDTLEQIINLPRNSSDRPNDVPYLDHVSIVSAPQDGTLTIQSKTKDGGTAHITVTLDDGQGNVTQQTFTVEALGMSDPGVIHVAPGQTVTFNPQINGYPGAVTITASQITTPTGASMTVDSATNAVTVTSPASYHGVFAGTLTVAQTGDQRTTTRTFMIASQDAADPQVTTGLEPGVGEAQGSVVVGDKLYVAAGSSGLEVFSLTDPVNPQLLGTFKTSASAARDVKVVGDYAYVADTFNGLQVLNVTDPASITLQKTIDLGSAAVNLDLVGNVLYVAAYASGLITYNVSNPANPKKLSSLTKLFKQTDGTWFSFGAVAGVAVSGKYAYISDMGGYVVVASQSSGKSLKFVTGWGTGVGSGTAYQAGSPWGMDIANNTLFVTTRASDASGFDGVIAYDISNVKTIANVGNLAVTDGPWQIKVINQTAVIGNSSNGYTVAQVSDPTAMSVAYSLSSDAAGGVATNLEGNVYLPLGSDGTAVLDGTSFLDHLTVQNSTVTFLDQNGVSVTVKTGGGAKAVVNTSLAGHGSIQNVVVTSPGSAGTVTITSKGGPAALNGRTTLGGIQSTGLLSSFSAASSNLGGDAAFLDPVLSLSLGDVSGRTISIGAPASGDTTSTATLTFDRVADSSVISTTPLKSLTATEWLNTDGVADTISAPSLTTLTIKGDKKRALAGNFQANLSLDGTGVALGLQLLGSASIAGNVGLAVSTVESAGWTGGVWTNTWDIAGRVGTIAVAGGVGNVQIRADRGIGSVSFGAAAHTDVFAGVSPAALRHAGSAVDFLDPSAAIGTIRITGLKGTAAQPAPRWFYYDSNFSAATVGTTTLLNVNFNNTGSDFGLFAESTAGGTPIGTVNYSDTVLKTKASWPKNSTIFPTQDLKFSELT